MFIEDVPIRKISVIIVESQLFLGGSTYLILKEYRRSYSSYMNLYMHAKKNFSQSVLEGKTGENKEIGPGNYNFLITIHQQNSPKNLKFQI